MEKYEKADKRNNMIIQGMNIKNSNKNDTIDNWKKNTYKNGMSVARFNSLDDNLQIMHNTKHLKRKKIYMLTHTRTEK